MKYWILIFATLGGVIRKESETKYLLVDLDKRNARDLTRFGVCGTPCESNGDCFNFLGPCFLCDFPGVCSSFKETKKRLSMAGNNS